MNASQNRIEFFNGDFPCGINKVFFSMHARLEKMSKEKKNQMQGLFECFTDKKAK